MTHATRILALSIILAGAGCTATNPIAPRESIVAGTRIQLAAAYLWRDFMPISPPDGKPLMASIAIAAADSSPLPPALRADSLWLYASQGTWVSPVTEQVALRGISSAWYWADNGPKWQPGTTVDVVLSLRDATGNRVLLGTQGVTIARTD